MKTLTKADFKTDEEYSKWLSDEKTLQKHYPKWERDKDGFLKKDTERGCIEKRVLLKNSDRYVALVNEEIAEIKDKDKLNKFILDDSKIPQRLDHAVGNIKIGDKRFRYYGARINEFVIKKQNGKLIQTTELSPAIITEEGEIITENNKPESIEFVFDSIMTLKVNRWSLCSIKKFCEEKRKTKKEEYTFEKVFNCFKKFYEEGMVFEDELWYCLLPLRDIKSYFWDLNEKFLIIKHEGISGVAKSKGMKIGANLSFNGKKFLCPTPANFFRYRHHNKATFFLEEVERLFDNSKKKNVSDSELVEYLNGSYEKGNRVPRQNDKNINQTDEFDPAGDTALGSINPLKGALEKRSVALHMIKASKKDDRGNIEPPTEDDPEYREARNKAYICGLLNYRQYEEALKEVKNNYDLANRQWILSKPLIALAKCVNSELEEKIGKFLTRLFEVRDDSFDEESWEILMAKSLVKIFSEYSEETFLSVESIKNKFIGELNSHGQSQYNISNTKTGILMRELGFTKFKANPTGNQRGYRMDFFKVIEILMRQEIFRIENILKIVSEVSGCKYNEDKINKWYTDTLLTPYTLINKKEDKSDTLTDRTLVFGGKVGSYDTKFITLEPLNLGGYRKGQEIEINLEPDKEYSTGDLGDLGKEIAQILLKENKIKLLES